MQLTLSTSRPSALTQEDTYRVAIPGKAGGKLKQKEIARSSQLGDSNGASDDVHLVRPLQVCEFGLKGA